MRPEAAEAGRLVRHRVERHCNFRKVQFAGQTAGVRASERQDARVLSLLNSSQKATYVCRLPH